MDEHLTVTPFHLSVMKYRVQTIPVNKQVITPEDFLFSLWDIPPAKEQHMLYKQPNRKNAKPITCARYLVRILFCLEVSLVLLFKYFPSRCFFQGLISLPLQIFLFLLKRVQKIEKKTKKTPRPSTNQFSHIYRENLQMVTLHPPRGSHSFMQIADARRRTAADTVYLSGR